MLRGVNPLWVVAGIAAAAVGIAKLLKSEQSAGSVDQPVTQPRAFISFDYDHNLGEKNLFAGQLSKRSPTPFAAQDWSAPCHRAGESKEIAMAVAQDVPLSRLRRRCL